jgi:hypothetical protein
MVSLGLTIDIICFGALVVFFSLCLKDRAKEQDDREKARNKGPGLSELMKAS